jgi:hypothetical protein
MSDDAAAGFAVLKNVNHSEWSIRMNIKKNLWAGIVEILVNKYCFVHYFTGERVVEFSSFSQI